MGKSLVSCFFDTQCNYSFNCTYSYYVSQIRIAKLKMTVKICIEIVKKSFRDAIKPGIDKIMSNTIARITYRTCWK